MEYKSNKGARLKKKKCQREKEKKTSGAEGPIYGEIAGVYDV